MRFPAFIIVCALAGFAACTEDDPPPVVPGPEPEDTTITEYSYQVLNTFPHDPGALTQGLIWDDTVLVEGTGYFGGESTLRRVELETGQVVQRRQTPNFDFGEGIARVGDRIVQLTWTERIAYVYDATTFDSLGSFSYGTEGWGLTHDGARFIMSDGTSTLYFRDLVTFAETGRVTVRDENGPVAELNELEYIDGRVWANVYQTFFIVIIDPATGRVRGRADMTGLIFSPPDVLNGIAFDPVARRLFVTGKRWSSLFEIRLVETTSP
jgi:glutamine cyclotransferase